MNDYELFLNGCYYAIVEIKNEKELNDFIDFFDKVGFKDYIKNIKNIEKQYGMFHIAKINGVKELCFEYQMGKGFTFGDKQDYLETCEETKLLSINDLIKCV